MVDKLILALNNVGTIGLLVTLLWLVNEYSRSGKRLRRCIGFSFMVQGILVLCIALERNRWIIYDQIGIAIIPYLTITSKLVLAWSFMLLAADLELGRFPNGFIARLSRWFCGLTRTLSLRR